MTRSAIKLRQAFVCQEVSPLRTQSTTFMHALYYYFTKCLDDVCIYSRRELVVLKDFRRREMQRLQKSEKKDDSREA